MIIRQIPLDRASLWAANRIKETNSLPVYAFPRYTKTTTNNGNSTSAAINKWIATSARGMCDSLFQTFHERPTRGVKCFVDMIDQIGGWSTAGIGQAYGEGYNLKALFYNMKDI